VAISKSFWRSAAVAAILAFTTSAAWALKVDVTVNKMSQKMTVRVDGQEQYVWLVSTGGVGYETPSGSYHVFRMEKEHFSKEWDDAPMPYSMFFTGEGHAIHGSLKMLRFSLI
jgi:L,D-transpeptidase catalytic domain